MRDAEKTIGNMIDKLKIAFLGSVDEEGFPYQWIRLVERI